jgi:hypothetical protein
MMMASAGRMAQAVQTRGELTAMVLQVVREPTAVSLPDELAIEEGWAVDEAEPIY